MKAECNICGATFQWTLDDKDMSCVSCGRSDVTYHFPSGHRVRIHGDEIVMDRALETSELFVMERGGRIDTMPITGDDWVSFDGRVYSLAFDDSEDASEFALDGATRLVERKWDFRRIGEMRVPVFRVSRKPDLPEQAQVIPLGANQ